MTRTPHGAPWRVAASAAAACALLFAGTTTAFADEPPPASPTIPVESRHVPAAAAQPSAEQRAGTAADPTTPRNRSLGMSAADAAAEIGDDAVARITAGTGSISGTITKLIDYKADAPLSGATVTAHTYDGPPTDVLSPALATATSGADGSYTLTGLSTGSYVVLVKHTASGSKLLPDFYPNAAYASQAEAVQVTDGQDTPSIDELLAPLLSGYVAGASRYETSAAIAAEFQANVDCVYLASGANFPDALSAAPAAATCGGPLLLVEPNAVPAAIAAQLARLNPSSIHIAGGTGAVSNAVQTKVSQLVPGAAVSRLAGADRYATSRAIVGKAFGTSEFVWIATGANFPDALSASNAAAAYGEPVLIVPGTAKSLDKATMATIAARNPAAVAIAGGTGVVSTGIENQLWNLYGKIRLQGADRYGTSLAINKFAWDVPEGHSTSVYAFLTNGTKFPDALSGAAMAGGRYSAPMYAVPPACVPDAVQQHIKALKVYEAYLLGYFSKISFAEPLKRC